MESCAENRPAGECPGMADTRGWDAHQKDPPPLPARDPSRSGVDELNFIRGDSSPSIGAHWEMARSGRRSWQDGLGIAIFKAFGVAFRCGFWA